jgi:hypothetical protein
VKQTATKGDVKSARILAREVIRANKQIDRLSVSKAQLGSINSQLQQQLGALSLCSLQDLSTNASVLSSHGQGHGHTTEVDRDYEGLESAYSTSSIQPSYARHEHGDDQGALGVRGLPTRA